MNDKIIRQVDWQVNDQVDWQVDRQVNEQLMDEFE